MILSKFRDRVESISSELDFNSDEYSRFKEWERVAKIEDVYQINLLELSESLNIDSQRMLKSFITMAKNELLDISWEYHCPSCNGVAEVHNHLAEVSKSSSCKMCQVDFYNILDENIGVAFTPSEEFIKIPKKFLEGLEKMRKMAINGSSDQKMEVVSMLKGKTFVSGLDCLHIEEFRDLFDDDNLPFDESLMIKNISILFTDVKGSTALYNRVGDATAYRLIREHFDILFKIIIDHGGIVIKTIGDAVMASFKTPRDSISAAIQIRRSLKEYDTKIESEKEILVKMGLHKGSTIMVTLNKSLDYFGQTVNIAARIQGEAKNNQIIISENMFKDQEVKSILKSSIKTLTRRRVKLRGIDNKRDIYILNFKD
ncbi:adenylate/guanylate cyclase domain-containing protein [Thiospirochaeta perfilievii]|nr:adenylate/guanylate cyclase domain-containing protein [Thiospirochaeta perfilievii]